MSLSGRPALLVILGPQAVGKMTVGHELERITDFRLFHAHRTVDLVTDFFEYGTPPFRRVLDAIRLPFFEECATAGMHLILTYGWRFEQPEDLETIDRYSGPFLDRGGEVYFAELQAPLEVRLQRNETVHRRAQKKVDWATAEYLAGLSEQHRLSSDGDFPYPERHMLLDNTELPAADAARQIKEFFGL